MCICANRQQFAESRSVLHPVRLDGWCEAFAKTNITQLSTAPFCARMCGRRIFFPLTCWFIPQRYNDSVCRSINKKRNKFVVTYKYFTFNCAVQFGFVFSFVNVLLNYSVQKNCVIAVQFFFCIHRRSTLECVTLCKKSSCDMFLI